MNTFLRAGIAIVFILVSSTSFSQEDKIAITGQILDLETSQPISFASIYIKSESIGTTSNENGNFIFHIPTAYKEDIVVISTIGYLSISKKVSSFVKSEKIYLTAQATNLDEVVITANKKIELTAKQIVQKAYIEIKNNYPTKPYILEGYVRDLQKEDDKYVEYLECAAKFSYEGYKTQKEPLIELLEVKTNYLADKHLWNKNTERKNSIIDLVEDDLIRFDYGPIKGKKGWKYQLESILPYGNGLVYKITGVDKPFQTSTLFIDTESFAFVRIELTRKATENKSWTRRMTSGAIQMYYNLILEYQDYKGKMYLKYQKEEDNWQIFEDLESNEILFKKFPKKELFINKIIAENIEDYPFERNMDISTSIEKQAKEFNSDFWNSYNIPAQTEQQSKIIKELKSRTN